MKPLQTPAAFGLTAAGARALAPLSPSLAGLAAARLWFTPWPVPVSDRALEKQALWLRSTEPLSFRTRDGHRLHGFAAGDGPNVLLVHGWGEWASNLGAFIDPLTKAGYRVAAFDLPGHGASSGSQTDAYVNAAAVRDAAAFLGGVHAIVAHSMGAHATTVALHRGLEVNAVALLAPVVRLYTVELFKEMLSLPEAAARALKATIERRYGSSVWTDLSTELLAREIETPALLVHDPDDDQVAVGDVRMLAEAWNGARLVATEGLGHGRIIRDAHVIRHVVGFLDDHARPAYLSSGVASASS